MQTKIAPTKFDYIKKRCVSPLEIINAEIAMVNNEERKIVILRDSQGKVFRTYQDIISNYIK